MKNKLTITTATLAVLLTQANNESFAATNAKEKCYGVSKAMMNDCAAYDGSHSCASQAKIDSDPGEWIFVPKGLCNKLTNGSLTGRLMTEKEKKNRS
jgi:uncharacterized membrane protein